MAKLVWDQSGEHFYETGVDRGVIYPFASGGGYAAGEAWNGLRQVDRNPSGAEPTALYANNKKYLSMMSVEELGLTIGAYTSPDGFAECDGSKEIAPGVYLKQQDRKHFGFCYRTLIGNDEEGTAKGYKLHLVYDCLASPSEDSNSTVNDSPEAKELSWSVTTNPIAVTGIDNIESTCDLEIDSTKISAAALAAIEAKLYGTSSEDATLPTPAEIISLIGPTGATGATS